MVVSNTSAQIPAVLTNLVLPSLQKRSIRWLDGTKTPRNAMHTFSEGLLQRWLGRRTGSIDVGDWAPGEEQMVYSGLDAFGRVQPRANQPEATPPSDGWAPECDVEDASRTQALRVYI
ncbi:hypothetical protein TruAng_011796 [Truncatella angustata]|nr:hypothetical protein TruAng_011796 [Truncatella angustata]